MDPMNVFQQLWQNWIARPYSQPDVREHVWINELNQAVFARLEKILPSNVKVRTVTAPCFIYHTEAAGGYGVDRHAGTVESHRILIPIAGTFEERVNAAVGQLFEMIRGAGTVFFYTPVVPICADDYGDVPNRRHMVVRLYTTGETVDVG